MAYENFEKVTGTVLEINQEDSCCTLRVTLRLNRDLVHVIVTGETRVIDDVRLRRGMRIAVFYDASLPTPAVYPPQYRAEIVTALRKDQNVTLNYFDENLTAEDNSLRLNINGMTNIVTSNGQRYLCSPANAELLVYYTATTFSIPPQTSPQKIIVMCPYE
ncbi:MAG: hypothetical protein ACOX8H_12460 [Ruminococcus sp.]|jgi:hypothetical protein